MEIKWRRVGRLELEVDNPWIMQNNALDHVIAWCEQHDCGRRTSFHQFKFRNEKEITLFLLQWGS